jgi:hypothetical protein
MVNYTREIEEDMYIAYGENKSQETVEMLAAKYGKPTRSIISKLSAMGIYEKKRYISKLGAPPISKEVYIERIGKLLDIDPCLLDSLEKVTKQALVLMDKKIEILKNG